MFVREEVALNLNKTLRITIGLLCKIPSAQTTLLERKNRPFKGLKIFWLNICSQCFCFKHLMQSIFKRKTSHLNCKEHRFFKRCLKRIRPTCFVQKFSAPKHMDAHVPFSPRRSCIASNGDCKEQ